MLKIAYVLHYDDSIHKQVAYSADCPEVREQALQTLYENLLEEIKNMPLNQSYILAIKEEDPHITFDAVKKGLPPTIVIHYELIPTSPA